MDHVFAKFGLTSLDALPDKAFYGRAADDQHPRHVSDYTVELKNGKSNLPRPPSGTSRYSNCIIHGEEITYMIYAHHSSFRRRISLLIITRYG